MSVTPPGTLRVALLLARTAARRRVNRILGNWRVMFRRRSTERKPVARKSSRSGAVLLVVGVFMMLQSVMVSATMLGRMTHEIEQRHGIETQSRDESDISFDLLGWPPPALEATMTRVLAVVVALLGLALVLSGLGSVDRRLAQVGWTLEWLFTFPVPTRGLFLARIGEYALADPLPWFTVFPLLSCAAWAAGHGLLVALGLAAAAVLAWTFVIASIRLMAEVWLRSRVSFARLRNVQAMANAFGFAILLGAFYVAFSVHPPRALFSLAESFPLAATWFPLTLPALVPQSPIAVVGLAAFAVLFMALAVTVADRLVRHGLVAEGNAVAAGRRTAPEPRAGRRGFRGVFGKEAKLLLRDRNFAVQTLVLPVLLIVFWIMTNPARFGGGGPGGAALAFGVASYVLIQGAFSVVASEGRGIWLLYTLPHELTRLVRSKARLWGTLAAAYAVGALAFAWRPGPVLHARDLLDPALAVGGAFLFAYVGAGLGVFGSDPLQEEVMRRIRPEWTMLYLLLAAMFGYAIYQPSVWAKLVALTLHILLAWAIWDKARDRLPLLLDPTQLPAPRLAPGDGVIAAILFFTVQVIAAQIMAFERELAPASQLLIAYFVAGVVTVFATLYVLWRTKLPHLLESVGLRRAERSPPLGRAVGLGAATGLLVALFGVAYLRIADWIPPLRALKERQMALPVGSDDWIGIAFLAVVLAPLFEEFVFRGVLFRGMRHSIGPRGAILASAAIFAVIHPPLSALPVFALGAAAALVFERTRILAAPIAAHMVYNGVVVLYAHAAP